MSQTQTYFYEAEAEWLDGKQFKLTSGTLPAIAGGAPPEFHGKEDNWSPEHLFVASMNSCYALTLLAIAELSKIPIASLSSIARGKLEKMPAGYQITEIIVKPRVVIASAGDLTRMPRILDKAKENCFISNSIKSTIKIEPQIFHRQTPASPCPLGNAPPPAEDIQS
jgi:organic hydroperoxide reductase OsmC/OhrA